MVAWITSAEGLITVRAGDGRLHLPSYLTEQLEDPRA
ncbi:MAG: hypothetical protein JWN03_3707 [Nocardia sp.]|nr:hypothetical protein [Nocardia sp.]